MPTVNFIETTPSEDLAKYIDAFWHCHIIQKGTIRLLPTACSELMFAYTSYGSEIVFIGPMETSQAAHVKPGDVFVGARLRVGGRTFFQKKDYASIKNSALYGHDIDSEIIEEFEKEMSKFMTVKQLMNCMQSLIKLLVEKKLIVRDGLVDQFILAAEKHNGQVKVAELMDNLPISPRQFRRRFIQYTAFTPKTFLKILRQQAAITELKQKYTSITEIAAMHGYSDHAHFSNEFRNLTGITPIAFDKELTLK